ncbi:MAG: hypothetical protein WC350_06110 [Candidatus Micrarchaeia archaeon]|jgi:hypothetical protein
MERKKVLVSERALIARINRKLQSEGERKKLHKTRDKGSSLDNLGRFHVVDEYSNYVVDHHINDLEAFGRDMQVLAEWEKLAE